MAREQVGTAPVRPEDAATVSWVQEQLSGLASTLTTTQGNSALVVGEIPAGNRDGTNQTLVTAYAFVPGSTSVFVNGLREALNLTYTEQAPDELILSSPPLAGDDIVVSYQRQ